MNGPSRRLIVIFRRDSIVVGDSCFDVRVFFYGRYVGDIISTPAVVFYSCLPAGYLINESLE